MQPFFIASPENLALEGQPTPKRQVAGVVRHSDRVRLRIRGAAQARRANFHEFMDL